MEKKSLILICLLSTYLSTYRPMTMKSFDFGEDVCYYSDVSHNFNFDYVKPCENGKKCLSLNDSPYSIKKCLDYSYLYRTLNDDCNSDEECPGTLICNSNKCNFDGNKPFNSHCPSGKVIDTDYTCKEKTNGDKCEVNNADGSQSEIYRPGYFKICGLIDLQPISTGSNNYYEKTVSSSFYCSTPDDSFVRDKFACEHGFALYFYANKKYKPKNNPLNPSSSSLSSSHQMYLRCVTVTGVDKEKKVIKYKIGESGTEQYYLIDELTNYNNYKSDMENEIDEFTMTKLEIFQNYKKRYDQIKDECSNLLYLDELKTCRDDELRKWYYFYLNPEEYILYQNEPQIMEYLIQTSYPNYKAEHTKSTSRFLSLNILILLFALISF